MLQTCVYVFLCVCKIQHCRQLDQALKLWSVNFYYLVLLSASQRLEEMHQNSCQISVYESHVVWLLYITLTDFFFFESA